VQKGGKETKVAKKNKPKVLEDLAAVRIQSATRQRAALKQVGEMRDKQKAYKEEMEQLKKNAYMAELEHNRRQEEKERKKQREIKAKRERRAQLKEQLLEYAFDGEKNEVQKILSDPEMACSPKLTADEPNSKGDTALSEACAGGDLATVQLLLELGANPNSQGEHMRTPLYRAAFAKHTGVTHTTEIVRRVKYPVFK
jgi:ankyrin repeat protein